MTALLDIWWIWLAAALVLAILELVLPGQILLGFAIGALATAVLVISPFAPGGVALLALFALFSLVAWLVLRQVFASPKGSVRRIERDVNDD